MAGNKPVILGIGDGVATTGFARVLHSNFRYLKKYYDIHHLAVNYRGDPHEESWKIYPAHLGGDLFGFGRLDELMKHINPDLVFILNDLWAHPMYMQKLDKYAGKVKFVLYSPVDSKPMDYRWVSQLEKVDRLVLYTEFGKEAVEDAINVWREKDETAKPPRIDVVPHGVDTKIFHPLFEVEQGMNWQDARKEAKRKLYPKTSDFIDSFIVLNANRNQPRKRIDTTIKGFAMFAEGKPLNVKMYLHMGVEDMGWNVIHLCERYGIDDRLVISSNKKEIPGIPDDRLNLIYNSCDVGINTSVGEGWGLPSFEHAATGGAQIVPDHSVLPEIWEDNALFMETQLYLTNDQILTEGGIVTPDHLALHLEALYNDRDSLNEMSWKAYNWVNQPKFTWRRVAKQWHKLFQEVLKE